MDSKNTKINQLGFIKSVTYIYNGVYIILSHKSYRSKEKTNIFLLLI